MANLEDRKLPPMPRFESEEEEAQWWFDHREELSQDMIAAVSQGKLGMGTAARRAKEAAMRGDGTIQLAPEDVELARRQASSYGMEYQSYLRMILHRALEMEEKRA